MSQINILISEVVKSQDRIHKFKSTRAVSFFIRTVDWEIFIENSYKWISFSIIVGIVGGQMYFLDILNVNLPGKNSLNNQETRRENIEISS